MYLILVLYFSAIYQIQAQGASTDGNSEYVVNFDSPVYMCSDSVSQAFADTSGIEVQRHNETTAYLIGFVNFLKGLDHHTMLEVKIEKESSSGRYELVVSHEICDLCQEIALNKDSNYHKYIKYFGFPDKCPFDPNEYPIHDFVADTEDFPVNAENAGRYQLTMNFYQTKEDCKADKNFIGCLKLDLIIEK